MSGDITEPNAAGSKLSVTSVMLHTLPKISRWGFGEV